MTRQVQVWGIAAVGKVIYPDDFVVQLYPPNGTESPASRLARLQWLFNPTDDNGEALPPLIDKETFMKLINEPEPAKPASTTKRASFKSDGDDYEEGVGENRCVVSSAGGSRCRLPAGHSGFCRDGRGVWSAAVKATVATVRAWKCKTCGAFEATNLGPEHGHVGAMSCRCGPMPACDPASLDLVPMADGESNLAGRLAASRLMRDHWEQTAADVLSNVPLDHDGELTPDKFKWLMLKVLPPPPRDVAKLSEQRLFDLAALRDQLGDKDHAIAELHAKVGQLTMERDEARRGHNDHNLRGDCKLCEALRKAGRR